MNTIEVWNGEVTFVVQIDHYLNVPGSFSYNAPSDLDYRGYEEMDWTLLETKDEDGKPVPYLLTDDDETRIEQAITDEMAKEEP